MSLIVDNNIFTGGFVIEEFNETKQYGIGPLPDELVWEVFSYLNLATLGTICCVNKEWKRLASEPFVWKTAIFKELAFGNDKWAKYFGDDVVKNEDRKEEFSSLPLDIAEHYKRFQKCAFLEKNAKDSLMLVRLPKTLNGQLTLKSLGELAKQFFTHSAKLGYRGFWEPIQVELGDKSIDESRWVLMTKDVLPGSRIKSYTEQQDIVCKFSQEALIGCEIPETLEAAVCILSQYFDSNTRFFGDNPPTDTRCQEIIEGYQVLVGGLRQGWPLHRHL